MAAQVSSQSKASTRAAASDAEAVEQDGDSLVSALPPIDQLVRRSVKRARTLFASAPNSWPQEDIEPACVTSYFRSAAILSY